ncbi:hypothetical protein CYMTET_25667 [Cymbomonas tetramitiformis]|uniref:Uncharacterized protein n=1 Tax=Cymbomonas tetramitiformis TaxID=36881 RepID=A0AAE0KYT8_9CHLO|nr:hypothetical protein CYMTET_25667 [Cymbomonas tetramitiformis]
MLLQGSRLGATPPAAGQTIRPKGASGEFEETSGPPSRKKPQVPVTRDSFLTDSEDEEEPLTSDVQDASDAAAGVVESDEFQRYLSLPEVKNVDVQFLKNVEHAQETGRSVPTCRGRKFPNGVFVDPERSQFEWKKVNTVVAVFDIFV